MLDCSPAKITEYCERYQHDFWQLRTPLTRYRLSGKPYGLDNGCYNEFKKTEWRKLLREAEVDTPIFVCLPDIVGDARRTLDLFEIFKPATSMLPRALVAQDGIENHAIPWQELECIFIGGTDSFKMSEAAFNVAKTAKLLGKWVHVGRVNTPARLDKWGSLADSIDGSGLSRFDHMLEDVLHWMDRAEEQMVLIDDPL